jgi:TPR repeat protein
MLDLHEALRCFKRAAAKGHADAAAAVEVLEAQLAQSM